MDDYKQYVTSVNKIFDYIEKMIQNSKNTNADFSRRAITGYNLTEKPVKIQFKDLGLLVIDEEHRFGVRHKEKLKQLKENIDIISMSATPIPPALAATMASAISLAAATAWRVATSLSTSPEARPTPSLAAETAPTWVVRSPSPSTAIWPAAADPLGAAPILTPSTHIPER